MICIILVIFVLLWFNREHILTYSNHTTWFRSPPVAYCDAGAAFSEDYISDQKSSSERLSNRDALRHNIKQYNVELKPLLSAFEFKTFAITSLRSFLLFYLPLLEPREDMEDDDDYQVDLIDPFKKSVKQIIREVSIILFFLL